MRHYLDYAATAPLRPESQQAWLEASAMVGNPSSTHGAGQDARRALEEARERIASVLGADPIEVVLTSGGTESINAAVHGLWTSAAPDAVGVVLPDGEHHASTESVAALNGAVVHHVPLTRDGAIRVDAFADALGQPNVAFATALWANNEVGTINDVEAIAAASAAHHVPLHLDAVAALGHVPIRFGTLRGEAPAGKGLVALSIAGHKVGAPVGTGALVVHRTAHIGALLHGGSQQRGIRAGTQDIAGATALATALELGEAERRAEGGRLLGLRNALIAGIRREVPQAQLLGDPVRRLPGNVHMLFPDAVGESLLFLLDAAGISASTGSACQAGVAEPSHVVLAIGRSDSDARSVLRFTLGTGSTQTDVNAVIGVIAGVYARAAGSPTAKAS